MRHRNPAEQLVVSLTIFSNGSSALKMLRSKMRLHRIESAIRLLVEVWTQVLSALQSLT
jgi:hypothetical protein